jgi:hypothetical protein
VKLVFPWASAGVVTASTKGLLGGLRTVIWSLTISPGWKPEPDMISSLAPRFGGKGVRVSEILGATGPFTQPWPADWTFAE